MTGRVGADRPVPAETATLPPIPDAHTTVPPELPRIPQRPKRILVLGAGMAGLVAAHELLANGHEPVVLEARRRVGGRIHTVRDFAPGLYAEAGAMRIPSVHRATLAYCRRFGLPLRPATVPRPRSLAFLDDRLSTLSDMDNELAAEVFPFAQHEKDRTRQERWREATEEVRDRYDREGKAGIEALAAKYDSYSIRGFLRARGWSEGAIEQYGVMSFSESNLSTSIMQEFRELICHAYEDTQEIVGGMDRLPRALYDGLRHHIRFGAEVFRLEQDAEGVTARVRVADATVTVRGDYAVCTVPFSVLRYIDTVPAFSHGKRKAVRQLHYDAATKIYFQMRRPGWERDGVRGGYTVTDLPIRRTLYPPHTDPDERVMLLASYTWGQDALQWSAMEPHRRVALALRDLARIHPGIEADFEAGYSYSWYRDPYARGAYALFEPEQQTAFYPDIVRPEGRIHFAGEHCSLWPAWIEGAVESGARAAREVHLAPSRAEV